MAQSLDDVQEETKSVAKVTDLAWHRSARSVANGQCVEAATLPDGRLAVRDSVDKSGPMVTFTKNEWCALLKEIKDGNFGAM